MTPSQTRALLAALSAECLEMGQAVEGLSALVLDHALRLPPEERTQALVQGQAVDALSQRLAAIAALTTALAQGGTIDEAVAATPLADLADRLRETVMDGDVRPSAPPRGGDLVLFD